MKITITPTDPEYNHNEVSVATKNDDLAITEAVRLCRYALLAWGYAEKSIDEEIGEDS